VIAEAARRRPLPTLFFAKTFDKAGWHMQLPIVSEPQSLAARGEAGGPAHRGRYAVVSLGCPKNLVDTEQMLGRLDQDGYAMVDEIDGADFVVVNTCGFIDSARQESLGAIDEMLSLKRDGRIQGVIVNGMRCSPSGPKSMR
jgi:ribosomal protein S12 methylthiotransferase